MFDSSSLDEIRELIAGATDVDCRLVDHSLGPFDCAFDIGLVDDEAVDGVHVDAHDGEPSRPVYQTLRLQMRVCEIVPVN